TPCSSVSRTTEPDLRVAPRSSDTGGARATPSGVTSTPHSPRERIDDELAALGAALVEERVLRRVIKQHRAVRGFGLHVPHERCYVLPRADLERHVDPSELAVSLDRMPAEVILVTGEREQLAADDPRAQTALWRAV